MMMMLLLLLLNEWVKVREQISGMKLMIAVGLMKVMMR
jgi:hypothetical protein